MLYLNITSRKNTTYGIIKSKCLLNSTLWENIRMIYNIQNFEPQRIVFQNRLSIFSVRFFWLLDYFFKYI